MPKPGGSEAKDQGSLPSFGLGTDFLTPCKSFHAKN